MGMSKWQEQEIQTKGSWMAYKIQMVDNFTISDGNVKYKKNEILFHICIVTKYFL